MDKNNLYTIRCLLNLTTENMGNDLGVTRQTVSNLEKGRVPFGKIYKLALGYLIEHEYAGKVSRKTESYLGVMVRTLIRRDFAIFTGSLLFVSRKFHDVL